jgi:CDK inhibitor PHO81
VGVGHRAHLVCEIDPVLLCNELGLESISSNEPSTGRTSLSVKEAVQIAKDNNFMGLICSSKLMVRPLPYPHALPLLYGQKLIPNLQDLAPPLMESIKTAGLVLISDISHSTSASAMRRYLGPAADGGVDGTVKGNGVLHFNDSVDL